MSANRAQRRLIGTSFILRCFALALWLSEVDSVAELFVVLLVPGLGVVVPFAVRGAARLERIACALGGLACLGFSLGYALTVGVLFFRRTYNSYWRLAEEFIKVTSPWTRSRRITWPPSSTRRRGGRGCGGPVVTDGPAGRAPSPRFGPCSLGRTRPGWWPRTRPCSSTNHDASTVGVERSHKPSSMTSGQPARRPGCFRTAPSRRRCPASRARRCGSAGKLEDVSNSVFTTTSGVES